MNASSDIGRLSSRSVTDFSAEWTGGRVSFASRARTDHVDGVLRSDHHLIMATLHGGARHHSFVTDDGLKFVGQDRRGMVSVLPAGCSRSLVLAEVEWTWAAFSIPASSDDPADLRSLQFDCEPLVFQIFHALDELLAVDRRIDPLLASSMAATAWRYVLSRHFRQRPAPLVSALPTWRLKRVRDHIEAHLDGAIAVADLAAICNLSERQFFRAFQQTTGRTPIEAINAARMDRGKELLRDPGLSVLQVAHAVGLDSPSYFARLFRAATGMTPRRWRQTMRPGPKMRRSDG